jgi:hypothetical protein
MLYYNFPEFWKEQVSERQNEKGEMNSQKTQESTKEDDSKLKN